MPTMKSGKGHFAAIAQRLAKKRSGKLQTGSSKGLLGAGKIGGSKRPAKSGKVQTSVAERAMNPEQQ